MPRAIDHLVIPARDLAEQADFYRRLGFQVGARNRHPWGTENHIVQFDGAFLELIGLGRGVRRAGGRARRLFVRRLRRRFPAAARGAGDAGHALATTRRPTGDNSRPMSSAISRASISPARRAGPTGARSTSRSRSPSPPRPALPEAGFFVCQQRFPENFWSRAAQVHPNGAKGIAGLAIAHESPGEATDFLTRFLGAGAARREGEGFVIEADGARIECAPRAALAERYGGSAIGADGPPIALARIAVADIEAARRVLVASRVRYEARGEALVVDCAAAMGAAIVFEPVRVD